MADRKDIPADTQATPNPADKPHPLDDLIASIRAAVAPGAATEVRAIGATACRSILTALETQVGQLLGAAPAAPAALAVPASPLASTLVALTSMPREQLLELAPRIRDIGGGGVPPRCRILRGHRWYQFTACAPCRPRGRILTSTRQGALTKAIEVYLGYKLYSGVNHEVTEVAIDHVIIFDVLHGHVLAGKRLWR